MRKPPQLLKHKIKLWGFWGWSSGTIVMAALVGMSVCKNLKTSVQLIIQEETPKSPLNGHVIVLPRQNDLGNRLLPTISAYYVAKALRRNFYIRDPAMTSLFAENYAVPTRLLDDKYNLQLKYYHTEECKPHSELMLCDDLTQHHNVSIESDQHFLPLLQNNPQIQARLPTIDIPSLFRGDGPLRPNAAIQNEHREFLQQVGGEQNYLAIHVRAREWFKVTNDQLETIAGCIRQLRRNENETIYLATDNKDVQKYLSEKFNVRPGFDNDQTSMNTTNAFLELLRLSHGRVLITRTGSTFSYSARSIGPAQPYYVNVTGKFCAPIGLKVPCYHMAQKCFVDQARCFSHDTMQWEEWQFGTWRTDGIPNC